MCTPFAHGLAGYAVLVLGDSPLASDLRGNFKAMGAGFFFGSLADADFLVDYYTHVPFLQYHYFSHSIPFALLVGIVAYLFLRLFTKMAALRNALLVTATYGSHLLLDYFTHDGSPPIGIPLLWPLTDKHFIAPVDIFWSIHRGSMEALFGPHNFGALFREGIILGPLALISYWKARKLSLSQKESPI